MAKKDPIPLFLPPSSILEIRHLFWPVLGIGMAGSMAGAAYLYALRLLEGWLGPASWSTSTHLALLAGIGLLAGILMNRLGNPGEMDLLVDNIHLLGGRPARRELRSLIPISLLCIASGGAAGPEAPLVQTTGTWGTRAADWLAMDIRHKRILTITGMAAGFTVLFGAPLGAAIFALEILHRRGLEYYEALIPALVGALCGYATFVLATGIGLSPIWAFPVMKPLQAVDLAWALGAGVVGGLVAIAFTSFNGLLRGLFLRVPLIIRPAIGGICLGLLAFVSPYALTFGEAQIQNIVSGPGVLTLMLLAAMAKFLGTSLTICSGWRGGFIIPLFFVGAALAIAVHAVLPGSNETVLMACLMVAINTGVTKTPLGSTLVVTHMAGLNLIPTTILAAVVSMLLTTEVTMLRSQRSREEIVGDESGAQMTRPS